MFLSVTDAFPLPKAAVATLPFALLLSDFVARCQWRVHVSAWAARLPGLNLRVSAGGALRYTNTPRLAGVDVEA